MGGFYISDKYTVYKRNKVKKKSQRATTSTPRPDISQLVSWTLAAPRPSGPPPDAYPSRSRKPPDRRCRKRMDAFLFLSF